MTVLRWSNDSLTLCSCGKDGHVYEWSAATWTKVAEQITRDTQYICAAYDPDGCLMCGLVERGRPLIRIFQANPHLIEELRHGNAPLAEALASLDVTKVRGVRMQQQMAVGAPPSEGEAKALYLEVNKGESVKEIDLPDAIAPERKGHIDWASEALRARYPDMFKPSERCRVPQIGRASCRERV